MHLSLQFYSKNEEKKEQERLNKSENDKQFYFKNFEIKKAFFYSFNFQGIFYITHRKFKFFFKHFHDIKKS